MPSSTACGCGHLAAKHGKYGCNFRWVDGDKCPCPHTREELKR